MVHLPGGVFFFSTAFPAVSNNCQDVLSSAAHIATREVTRCAFRVTKCQMNRIFCRCFASSRYGTETIPSQMKVCCNRNNLEKRFDKPGNPLGVCGMGKLAANCQRLFAQHINCWIPTLGTCSLLVKFSGELVASSLKKCFFLVGAMAQNASTSTTRT